MKKLLLFIQVFVLAAAMLASSQAQAVTHTVDITCFDNGGQCLEVIDPNKVIIAVGDDIEWVFPASCAVSPCGPTCTVDIPAGGGYPGYSSGSISPPDVVGPCPAFTTPGVYSYTVACSTAEGIIIVEASIPTLSEWGMIVLGVLVLACGAVVIKYRLAKVRAT